MKMVDLLKPLFSLLFLFHLALLLSWEEWWAFKMKTFDQKSFFFNAFTAKAILVMDKLEEGHV